MPERNVTYARSTDMSQRTVGGRYHLWMKTTTTTGNTANKTEGNNNQTKQNPKQWKTELDRFQTSILVNMTDTVSLSAMLRSVHCLRAMNSDIFLVDSGACEKRCQVWGFLLDRLIPQKGKTFIWCSRETHSKYMESNLPKLKSGNLKGLEKFWFLNAGQLAHTIQTAKVYQKSSYRKKQCPTIFREIVGESLCGKT